MIIAAHSDDCVIMGAEMAWSVVKSGGTIRVVYLTCSGPDPSSEIALTRAKEARNAWASLSSVSFHDLNLPESPVSGPTAYSPASLETAVQALEQIVRELPPDALVLVPASHEEHIDHRNARSVAIKACNKAERTELAIIETPEYNSVISLRADPVHVMWLILSQFPLVYRWLPERKVSSSFLSGPSGVKISKRAAFDLKLGMLQSFESQDPELLTRYFSWESRYRPLNKPSPTMPLLGGFADIAALVFIALLTLTSFAMGIWSAELGAVGFGVSIFVVLLLSYSLIKRRGILILFTLSFVAGFLIESSV